MSIIDELVEITLNDPQDFLKIKETLTRMGIASWENKTLYQSCHILHKRQKYYIVHFKELFKLDGKPSTLSESDIAKRNLIVEMLEEWGLLKIVDKSKTQDPKAKINQIKILPHKDKKDWKLEEKYTIGKK